MNEYGEVASKKLDDDRVISVNYLHTGLWRLCVGNKYAPNFYDDVYGYKTEELAVSELEKWTEETVEPDNWFRHPQTGRRRPNGDKTQEYVSW